MSIFRDRVSVADDIASHAGFTKEYIKAGQFTLMTYQKFNRHSGSISIYIEGDGQAWETRHKLSNDPTPLNPVALRLAAVDPAENIAYMARPGQYPLEGSSWCDSKYWSGSRFAPELINAFNMAIDILKKKSQARYVGLVGYSGGGAIAVLVAARRHDVITLRTVAGNLDPKVFCNYHHVSQLEGSMDPMDVARKVARIPQRHFIGSKDLVVPFAEIESFVSMEGDKTNTRITMVDGVSHNDGWCRHWRKLLLLRLGTINSPY